MSMNGRMPVVATTESGREFARRRNIGIAVQDVADLVRIFFLDACQRELGETISRFRVKFGSAGCRRHENEEQDRDGEAQEIR